MHSFKKYILILLGIVTLSLVSSLFSGRILHQFINHLFLISIVLCVLSGFRWLYERGMFRFNNYAFYKVGKFLGVGGPSKKTRYVESVERDMISKPTSNNDKPTDQDNEKGVEDFILNELPAWGFTGSLFAASISGLLLTFIISFLI